MPKRSLGTRFMIGANAVAGLTSIAGIAESADTLDTTTLDSSGGYRTFTGGFKDGGEVSISGYFEPGDTQGQMAMRAAFKSGAVTQFQILFPADLGASWAFDGVVTAFSTNADLEELIAFEATVKVSGEPSLVTTPSAGLSALVLTGAGGSLSPAFANDKSLYTYGGVSATSVTVTATAASHTLTLFVDGVYNYTLTTAVASGAIPLTLSVAKKLTIVAQETGKAPKYYEIVVIKTT